MVESSSRNVNSELKLKEKAMQGLPLKQRLCLEYTPLLYDIVDKYPTLYFCMNDKEVIDNLGDVFDKVGFASRFHTSQEARQMVHNLTIWLKKKNYLVLLNYNPKYSGATLLNLLRQVQKSSPGISFANLVPVFLKSVSSKSQMSIFQLLGNFGIRHAMFLTPNAAPEKNIEEILEGLVDFGDMLKEKVSEEEEEVREAGGHNLGKIEKYKELSSKGEELMLEGRYEDAIKVFTEAVNLKPNFDTLMQRGDAFFKVKKYSPALRDYKEANRLEQNVPQPFAKIGACCFALVKTSMEKDGPEQAQKTFEMGMRHLKLSENLIEESLRKNKDYPEKLYVPSYAPLLGALAETDIRGLGLKEAEQEIEKLTAKYIEKAKSVDYSADNISIDERIDHAILLTRGGFYGEAEKIFRTVIDKDPSHAGPAFNNFAVELRKKGQYGKSFETYKELLQFKIPDKNIVVENMKKAGLAYAGKLKEDIKLNEATVVFKGILAANPKKPEWILCELAETYLEMNDHRQASNRIMEALFANPAIASKREFKKFKNLKSLISEMSEKLSTAKKATESEG